MKVESELEKEHFITYVSRMYAPVQLIDKSGAYYTVNVVNDTFEIHEDIILEIRIKCQNINVEWKIPQWLD